MLAIRPLTIAEIPAAMRLSSQAGWNQQEADWKRLLDLYPTTCLAGWEGDRLAVTGTLATYGTAVGWLGMLLVDESCRGRGLGGAVFDAMLNRADELGINCLGLDATDLGRPVYLKRGFRDTCAINRWLRQPSNQTQVSDSLSHITRGEKAVITHLTSPVIEWVNEKAQVDRTSLLEHIQSEHGVTTHVMIEPKQEPVGVAFIKPGRIADHIGPVVAETSADACDLLEGIIQSHSSTDRPLFIDALEEDGFEKVLGRMGFVVQRRLIRMMKPQPTLKLTTQHVFAATSFELG